MASADVLEIFQMTALSELPPELQSRIAKAAPAWNASVRRGK
jgi:hypothetical protein